MDRGSVAASNNITWENFVSQDHFKFECESSSLSRVVRRIRTKLLLPSKKSFPSFDLESECSLLPLSRTVLRRRRRRSHSAGGQDSVPEFVHLPRAMRSTARFCFARSCSLCRLCRAIEHHHSASLSVVELFSRCF